MDRLQAITQLLNDLKVDKFNMEYWEENEEKDAEHLVKINVEKEYY